MSNSANSVPLTESSGALSDGDAKDNKFFFKWSSYENVLKIIRNLTNYEVSVDEFFQKEVTITDKIDGSNLAIHVKFTRRDLARELPSSWNAVALYGRNSKVWSESSEQMLDSVGTITRTNCIDY